MFWSKIWFFLVAVAAAVAITVALVMPRPAERTAVEFEAVRLERACSVANILLVENARARIQLAGEFARAAAPASEPTLRLDDILFNASKGDNVSGQENATGRKALIALLEGMSGNKPSFVILLDRKGRVVARAGLNEKDYGDSLAGFFAVDDALNGYLRDDLWVEEGILYRVATSPVVTRQLDWAGVVVIGQAIDRDFASKLSASLAANISFYVEGQAVAASDPVQIHKEVADKWPEWAKLPAGEDCAQTPIVVTSGDKTFAVLLHRLPGEAGLQGAFYSVFIEQEKAIGFMGTLKGVNKSDLALGKFPWIKLGIVFVLIVGIGFFFLIWETDRPLRKLARDAVALAQGEAERLQEESHRGKFGSIARSVNIAIDKFHRQTKNAKKDLDQLLGPAPDEVSALPKSVTKKKKKAFTPPPPSEFKFVGKAASQAPQSQPKPQAAPSGNKGFDLDIPPPPPSMVKATTPTKPRSASHVAVPPKEISLPSSTDAKPEPPPPTPKELGAFDDDILGSAGKPAVADDEDDTVISGASERLATEDSEATYFHEIFDDFIALKKKCGENTSSLTYEKFSKKLTNNRDVLIKKHGCKSVNFQVYIKDGKAALKASPVKD